METYFKDRRDSIQAYLTELAGPGERRRLDSLYGDANVSQDDIRFVQDLTRELGVQDLIHDMAVELDRKSRGLIHELAEDGPPLQRKYHAVLEGLLDYTLARTR
jgi:hypothetical protein